MKYWLLVSAIVGCVLGMALLIALALRTDVISDDELPVAVGSMFIFLAATTPLVARKQKRCCCFSRVLRRRGSDA